MTAKITKLTTTKFWLCNCKAGEDKRNECEGYCEKCRADEALATPHQITTAEHCISTTCTE